MMFVEVNRRGKQNIAFPDHIQDWIKILIKLLLETAVSSRLVSSINTIGWKWKRDSLIKEASSNNETGIIDGSRLIPNVLK